MSARELLASGAGITLVDEQIITVSGNWTKDAAVKPTDLVEVEMWGGGAGGSNSSTNATVWGGNGGTYVRIRCMAADLPSTVPVVVGAGGIGGASSGNSGGLGGNSSFAGIVAPGGKTGSGGSTTPVANDAVKAREGVTSDAATPVATASPPNEFYAAAQGSCFDNSTGPIWPAGQSRVGGNGGAQNSAGSTPGGGGGHAKSGTAGNGARGEVRVRVYRGAYK